jgi:Methyltransferase domain
MAQRSKAGFYHFHMIGLGSQEQMDKGEILQNGPIKTLQQVMTELGHEGRTIDIFKIDCEVHMMHFCFCQERTAVNQTYSGTTRCTLSCVVVSI